MKLDEVLTEEERKSLSDDVVAKIEAALRVERETEAKKSNARFTKILESVGKEAERRIDKAIQENVSKIKTNAMSDKMYKVLQAVAAVLENAEIPITEDTKRIQQELNQCKINLKKAYEELNHVKAEYNEQMKKNFIFSQVQGLKPNVQNAVMQHFAHSDVREVTKEAISNFLNKNDTNVYMANVDPNAKGELNMDRVMADLDDIASDLERDVPSYPTRSTVKTAVNESAAKRFETLGKGLSPTRVNVCSTPNVTLESLAETNANTELDSEEAGRAAAIKQVAAMGSLGMFI